MTPGGDSGPRKGDRFWDKLSAASVERPWALIAVGAALFIAAMPFAVRLYGDLRTDLRELLPQGAPAFRTAVSPGLLVGFAGVVARPEQRFAAR